MRTFVLRSGVLGGRSQSGLDNREDTENKLYVAVFEGEVDWGLARESFLGGAALHEKGFYCLGERYWGGASARDE